MRAIADVVRVMIDAVRDGKVINLNAVKNEAARRYGLKRSPKLVELIGAVPDEHRESLLPQLRAKPVRTASSPSSPSCPSPTSLNIATTETSALLPGDPTAISSTHAVVHRMSPRAGAIRARYDLYVQARGWNAAQVGSSAGWLSTS